jgi:hypothetical protein
MISSGWERDGEWLLLYYMLCVEGILALRTDRTPVTVAFCPNILASNNGY